MADPTYASPMAQLIVGLERHLLNKDPITGTTIGNPLFGLRFAGIDTATQPPSAFPAALIAPGNLAWGEDQEIVWNLSIALVVPAAHKRTGILQLLELQHELILDLREHSTTLADGWQLDNAWSSDVLLGGIGDPNNPTPAALFFIAGIGITAHELE